MSARKVLISAFACAPGRGSEPGVGWNMACAMARHHKVWVLTEASNRPQIEQALGVTPRSGLSFTYFALPDWARGPDAGYGLRARSQAYYYLWQLLGARVARRLHREIGFDVVHHVTFCKYWSPSLLASVDAPFVWGPVAGGGDVPEPSPEYLDDGAMTIERVRTAARWMAEKDPFVRRTARRSGLALAANAETAWRLRKLGAERVEIQSSIGLSQAEIDAIDAIEAAPHDGTRFVSVANLIRQKGIHLGIEAFAEVEGPRSEYWIVGDGPERGALEALCGRLGVAGRVRFWGRLPREDTLARIRQCDVMLHPSLRESGGYSILEGMAARLPVVCLDLGGPAISVTAETGIKIPPSGRRPTVRAIAAAMGALEADPQLRARMGRAGRVRLEASFHWERKAETTCDWYDSLDSSTARPVL